MEHSPPIATGTAWERTPWRALRKEDGPRVRLVRPQSLSARSLVLGGKVAIYDQRLRSRFDWLREPDPDAVATPPMLMVFDQDGCEFTGRPLREHRV